MPKNQQYRVARHVPIEDISAMELDIEPNPADVGCLEFQLPPVGGVNNQPASKALLPRAESLHVE